MNIFKSLRSIAACLASLLAISLATPGAARADILFGLLTDPTTTAGPGVNSTRSGAGSWQLYALDNSTLDFGIAYYNVTMSGATAINHRSPMTTAMDQNGDFQTAGFTLLR